MKWIKRIVILLVLVVVVVAVIAVVMIDRIAKTGVEQGGTYAMGVTTKLNGIHIGLLSGSVSLDGLSVANPEGFKADHFLKLGDGSVEVSLGSLMGDKVEVPSLKLNHVDIALEKDKGKANYDVILENLAKVTGSDAEPAPDEDEGKKFVIKELVITDVNVKAEVIGGLSVPVKVPEIRLTDIGTDSDKGVLLKDLSGIIVTAILATVAEQAGDILPGDIGKGLQGGLAAVGDLGQFGVQVVGDVTAQAGEIVGAAADKVGEAAGQVGDKAKAVGDEAGKAVEKLGEGLGGLLGGKKDKAETTEEKQ
ncbi:MAG: AsmA family protein [Phycisphaerales bacterium]